MTAQITRIATLLVGACWLLAGRHALAALGPPERLTQAALSLDAHPDEGEAKFLRYCAQCHGSKGQGDPMRAIPTLAGQRFNYLVRQISNFGIAERDNAAKSHIVADKSFSEPQTWDDVAAYLSRLTPAPMTDTGDGMNSALGRGIFHEQCAGCHRNDADGDKEGFIPSLRNQHYRYLVKQMGRLAEGHRVDVDPSLTLFMRSFDAKDMTAVADYLSRLREPGGRDISERSVVPGVD